MIERAAAFHAGAAVHLHLDLLLRRIVRLRPARIRRAEHRHHRHAEREPEVPRARVVRDEQRTSSDQRLERPERQHGLIEHDRRAPHRRRDGTATSCSLGPQETNTAAPVASINPSATSPKRSGGQHFAVPKDAAGVDHDDGPTRRRCGDGQTDPAPRLLPPASCEVRACRARLACQVARDRVVVSDHRDRHEPAVILVRQQLVRQKQAAPVPVVADSPPDPRQPRQQRRTEGVRQQNGGVEPLLPKPCASPRNPRAARIGSSPTATKPARRSRSATLRISRQTRPRGVPRYGRRKTASGSCGRRGVARPDRLPSSARRSAIVPAVRCHPCPVLYGPSVRHSTIAGWRTQWSPARVLNRVRRNTPSTRRIGLHRVGAGLPVGRADLAVLLDELEGLDHAQGLVDVAADAAGR